MKLFAAPTDHEWYLFVSIFIGLCSFIGTAEYLRSKIHGSPEITRKLVHVLTGVLIFFAPEVFYSGIPAILLASLFIAINFAAVQFGLLRGMHGTHRHSYGTVYYPLSFLILVLFFWDATPVVISVSIAILALGDAAAAIVGESIKAPHLFRLTTDKKSLEGSGTMFFVTFLLVLAALYYYDFSFPTVQSLLIGIAVALFVTAWEAISSKGFDNLTVPLGAAFMLYDIIVPSVHHDVHQMITGVLLALSIAIVSYRLKFLSSGGSVATFLLATVIYGIGGWVWTVPVLTFFISSSLLSKAGKLRKRKFESVFDKTDRRDEGQVAANGGTAAILILLWFVFPENLEIYLLYVASLAAVTADTWATEIGTLAKGKPVSIISLKKVEPGTSGGVSFIGLFGGCLGASIVALSAWVMKGELFTLNILINLLIASTVGSLIDSLLGATFQAQYQREDGTLTEKAFYDGTPTTLIRGVRWIDNDIVNWCCAISGAVTMYFLLQ